MTACPLDYSLCDRTVTVYRRQGEQVLRQVVTNCYFSKQEKRSVDTLGCRKEVTFQLIMPCTVQTVFPGDRIMEGVGPEVSVQQWPGFVPAGVAGLVEVAYVTPCYWAGELCHVEAGRK